MKKRKKILFTALGLTIISSIFGYWLLSDNKTNDKTVHPVGTETADEKNVLVDIRNFNITEPSIELKNMKDEDIFIRLNKEVIPYQNVKNEFLFDENVYKTHILKEFLNIPIRQYETSVSKEELEDLTVTLKTLESLENEVETKNLSGTNKNQYTSAYTVHDFTEKELLRFLASKKLIANILGFPEKLTHNELVAFYEKDKDLQELFVKNDIEKYQSIIQYSYDKKVINENLVDSSKEFFKKAEIQFFDSFTFLHEMKEQLIIGNQDAMTAILTETDMSFVKNLSEDIVVFQIKNQSVKLGDWHKTIIENELQENLPLFVFKQFVVQNYLDTTKYHDFLAYYENENPYEMQFFVSLYELNQQKQFVETEALKSYFNDYKDDFEKLFDLDANDPNFYQPIILWNYIMQNHYNDFEKYMFKTLAAQSIQFGNDEIKRLFVDEAEKVLFYLN